MGQVTNRKIAQSYKTNTSTEIALCIVHVTGS